MIKENSTFTEIITEFTTCIRRYGGSYNNWYVGLTNNAFHSLVSVHHCKINMDPWLISRECSINVQNKVKEFFQKMGCSFNYDLDVNNSSKVYIFKMA